MVYEPDEDEDGVEVDELQDSYGDPSSNPFSVANLRTRIERQSAEFAADLRDCSGRMNDLQAMWFDIHIRRLVRFLDHRHEAFVRRYVRWGKKYVTNLYPEVCTPPKWGERKDAYPFPSLRSAMVVRDYERKRSGIGEIVVVRVKAPG